MSATVVPAVTQTGQPILVLKEGRSQSKGRVAMENNIAAARLICEMVSTSLGPHGMDKLIVEPFYDGSRIHVTNDGAFMLKKMLVNHPAARMLVEVSKTTDNEVGDGTTSAVVLAGALLEKADELLQRGLHPLIVVAGFQQAAKKASEVMKDLAERIDPKDRAALGNAIRTSLRSKIVAENSARIAEIVLDAAFGVAVEQENGRLRVDLKNIKIDKRKGGSMIDSELVHGLVLEQKVAYPGMPRRVEKARIALVNMPFELEETQYKSIMTIEEPSQIPQHLKQQYAMYREMVDTLNSVGANVLICQKRIADMAMHYLAMSGILAVQKSLEFDAPNIARATGARMVSHLKDLSEKDLGYADLVEERRVDTDKMVFITGTKNPKSISILVRGANKNVADEVARSINDAIMVVRDLMQEPCVVVGGGAVEAEVAFQLTRWVDDVEGKPQLAAEKYAEAMEQIPKILAKNAGLDPINVVADLRAKHAQGGDGKWYGVPASGKSIANLHEQTVFEPLMVKEQVLRSATEVVCMLLRIDNVISITPPKQYDPYNKNVSEFKQEGIYPIAPPSDLARRT